MSETMLKQSIPSATSVADFYRNQNILVTGATGFMGKVLIEKLLWSCEEIGNIYILIRKKRDAHPTKRVEELIRVPVFDRIRKTKPDVFKKIVPICGDVTEVDLGISREDRTLLENSISIIIHAASSVRFDDPLKKSVLVNVRGTRDIMELAKNMKHLKVMSYISTSYCNCNMKVIQEKVIRSDYDWKMMIKLVETADENTLNAIQGKILDRRPNTYTFTKSLAENVVQDYSSELPCIIIRPSIVVFTAEEPTPGWIDNLNGPTGLNAGVMCGLIHVVRGNPDLPGNYIPCDLAVNGIIVATFSKGIAGGNGCEVMNSASGSKKAVELKTLLDAKDAVMFLQPPCKMMWYPAVTLTENKFLYFFLLIFTHVLPGFFLDLILKIGGVNFSILRIYRKAHTANTALTYFTTNDWKINTEKYDSIVELLRPDDRKTFVYTTDDIDLPKVIRLGVYSLKKFVFNDDMSEDATNSARRRVRILYWLHHILKYALYAYMLWSIGKFSFSTIIDGT